MADVGRKARREAAQGAKTDKPKRYEPCPILQDSEVDCRTFAPAAADAVRHYLHSCCWARMLARRVEREMPTRQAAPT